MTRPVVPLTKNSIRCFAGMNTYDVSKLTKEDIQKYAIRITVNEDATLTITSVGTMQVEMVDSRYRLLKDGCDGSNGDADYDVWHDIEETMTKKEPLINS